MAAVGFSLMTAACSTIQTYSGPARPDQDVSKVYFHSGTGVTLSAMTVDGHAKPNLANGFTALPGSHTFSLRYDLERRVTAGTCQGNFESAAGKEYIIDVIGGGSSPDVTVYTDGRHTMVGTADCR